MLAGLAEVTGAPTTPSGSFEVDPGEVDPESGAAEVVGAPTMALGSADVPVSPASVVVGGIGVPLVSTAGPPFDALRLNLGPPFVGLRMSRAVMALSGGVRFGMPDCAANETSAPVFIMAIGAFKTEFL